MGNTAESRSCCEQDDSQIENACLSKDIAETAEYQDRRGYDDQIYGDNPGDGSGIDVKIFAHCRQRDIYDTAVKGIHKGHDRYKDQYEPPLGIRYFREA